MFCLCNASLCSFFVASLCNEFHTGESGSIAITNDEKYVPYMNCLYTIETDISKRIQIQVCRNKLIRYLPQTEKELITFYANH